MSNIILALLLLIMIVGSLRAIQKPRVALHIDEVLAPETARYGWRALPWLVGLVLFIFTLRLVFGA